MLSEDRKIKTRAQLREYIRAEGARYPLSARRIVPYLLQISEGAILRRHIVLLRKTEYYTNTGRRLLAAFYHARLMKFQNRYGLHVPVNVCGKGLWISHVFPIAMNGNVTVGENCRVMPFSMLLGDDVQDLAPTVGDNVTLGPHSMVVGGVTVADGITVGAGAVVTHDFLEPDITLVGVPAKKLRGAKTGGSDDAR